MLAPKKVKHRKQHRGRARQAKGGTEIHFGDYGLLALEPAGSRTARSRRPVSR